MKFGLESIDRKNSRSIVLILFLLASWSIGNIMNLLYYSGGGTDQFSFGIDPLWIVLSIFVLIALLVLRKGTSTYLIAIFFGFGWLLIPYLMLRYTISLFIFFGLALIVFTGIVLLGKNLGKKMRLYYGGIIILGVVLTLIFTVMPYDLSGSWTPIGKGEEAPSILPWDETGPAVQSMMESSGLIVLGLICAVGIGLFLFQRYKTFKRSRRNKREEKELEENISSTVEDAISDLSEGKEVESTIRRCYQNMCFVLEEKGAKNEDFMTPREFELNAVERLSVPSAKIREIRSLFEKAKYGGQELGEEERDKAVKDLKDLKKELE